MYMNYAATHCFPGQWPECSHVSKRSTPRCSKSTASTSSKAEVEDLLSCRLITRPGMTAGAWQYIGSQGIVQGTYETFKAAGRQYFGGSLTGRLILTAGCGGMGGAQPLAGALAGASILVADVQQQRLDRRIREGYLEYSTSDIGEAIVKWQQLAKDGAAGSVGVAANIVDVLDEVGRLGIVPDIVTDQTTTEPLQGYVPVGLTAEDCTRLHTENPAWLTELSDATLVRHARSLLEF